jgi:hypothetical protein
VIVAEQTMRTAGETVARQAKHSPGNETIRAPY